MNTSQKEYLEACRATYEKELKTNILPFWLQHGLDTVNGGVYTCIDRDGTLMDSTKSVWFQGRFGYVCALAYNSVEKNATWLAASKSCIDFIRQHCIDTDGHLFFAVTAEGNPIQKRRYVFSECFAIMAMAEYAKATGNSFYAEEAMRMFVRTKEMLASPTFLPVKSLIPARGHSITMMLINVASILRSALPNTLLDQQIDESIHDLKNYFIKPEYKAILETVGSNGEFMDTCAGRTINPGHGIETAWFIMNEAKQRQGDSELTRLGVTLFDWCWKWGWDDEFGGIINFKDCKNFPPQDYSQDMKFWWTQCEAIIASLYAYQATNDERYLQLHKQVNDYAFAHFPDSEYGEWYGYLHRDGTVAQPAKGNLFKGPFHIPRMMIIANQLCNEILQA